MKPIDWIAITLLTILMTTLKLKFVWWLEKKWSEWARQIDNMVN